ncbi:MAG: peptidoglycan DD-metalloendopeptidase family protein [Candidatus Zambryskibacteria bacterium]|nr:peptidoglycan DD-metalloendopeptidase family protein [Candidatus Zambryskibacteria bacterium]
MNLFLESKKLSSFFKYVTLVSIVVLPQLVLAADSNMLSLQIEEVKRERETLLEEQRRLQAELEKVNAESRTLGTAVKSLDTARKKLAADIKVTQSKIAVTDLNIKQLTNSVTTAERRIGAHQKAIGSAIVVLFQYDLRPLLLDLLASASFSDVWRDRTQIEGLSAKLDNEVKNLQETKIALNVEKERKERTKQEILSLQNQLSGQKKVVEENKLAKERLLAETESKEALYQEMLRENLERQRQSEEDLFKLESELGITLDPTLIPNTRPGILSWPLDKVYITQRFGRTAGSARLYASGSHNGADFRAAQGTRIFAMLDGVVEGTGNTDEQKGCYSYGRWILLRHPNGLSSIYAHLSGSLVQKGQSVKTGEVIGYSGGTPRVFGSGYSTGPHLHIGLFASQGVAIRQFITSKNCKQVYIPIADIKAYLDPLAYLPSI